MKSLSPSESDRNNGDFVRCLNRSKISIFREIRKYLEGVNFRCERGLFAEAETTASDSRRRLHTLEEV